MLETRVTHKEGPPVNLIISEISRNGVVKVQFNQPLNVPDFLH